MTFSLTSGSTSGSVFFVGSGSSSTLEYTFDDEPYNALHLYGQTTTPGTSLSLSNLSFTSSTLSTFGQLVTSAAISQVSGETTFSQWLAAGTDDDLSLYDWVMSGRATLAVNGTNPSSGEGIKWELSAKEACIIVPEPSMFAAVVIAALAIFAVGCGCGGTAGCPSYSVKLIRPDGTVHERRIIQTWGIPRPEPKDGCIVVDCFPGQDIIAPAGWAIQVSPYGYYPPLPHTSPEAE